MYAFLVRFLRPRVAEVVAAIVYSLMILTILYCSLEPQAEFNYLQF
jgi:hypothetical protein